MSTLPTHESPSRRADIQGLRAVAVMLVVLYHADMGFSGGFVGVDVFFVISGFVITQLLLREHKANGRTNFVTFYTRRAKRLLPALALMLAVVLPASILLTAFDAQRSTARTGAAAALFNANNYLAFFGVDDGYFTTSSKANPLLHTWSLSLEEQFYFFFPAALAVLLWWCRRRSTRWPLVVGLASITAASFVLSVAIRRGRTPLDDMSAAAFYLAPARAWEFGVGALLAVAISTRPNSRAWLRSVAAVGGAVAVAVASLTFDDNTIFPDVAVVLPVVGTALLLWGGTGKSQLSRLLSSRPMCFVGDISYSWYLWHWPALVFTRAMWPEYGWLGPVAAIGSLAPAVLSYRYVENPIRSSAKIVGRRIVALAGVSVVLPLAAGAVLAVGTERMERTVVATAFRPHLDLAAGCANTIPLDERPATDCVWTTPGSSGEILLIGDSNAGHLSEALLGAARELRLDLRIATLSACPFIDIDLWRDGARQDACRAFGEGATEWILNHSPTVVVVANSSDGYIESDQFEIALTGQDRAAAPDDKSAVWADALASTLSSIASPATRVVVVHPVPKFNDIWRPREMAPLRLLLDPDGVEIHADRVSILSRQQRAREAVTTAAESAGTAVLDLFDDVCPEAVCQSLVDGKWLYRDHGHISVEQSIRLTPSVLEALRAALDSS